MIDQIKSNLTNHYLMFVFEFADPSSVNKDELSKAIDCPVIELFKSQKQADRSKKILGKAGFGQALMLYFDQFQSHEGIDFKKLERELVANKKVFLRHLGKDKVNYLSLLIKISETVEPRKRGLLSA